MECRVWDEGNKFHVMSVTTSVYSKKDGYNVRFQDLNVVNGDICERTGEQIPNGIVVQKVQFVLPSQTKLKSRAEYPPILQVLKVQQSICDPALNTILT